MSYDLQRSRRHASEQVFCFSVSSICSHFLFRCQFMRTFMLTHLVGWERYAVAVVIVIVTVAAATECNLIQFTTHFANNNVKTTIGKDYYAMPSKTVHTRTHMLIVHCKHRFIWMDRSGMAYCMKQFSSNERQLQITQALTESAYRWTVSTHTHTPVKLPSAQFATEIN